MQWKKALRISFLVVLPLAAAMAQSATPKIVSTANAFLG